MDTKYQHIEFKIEIILTMIFHFISLWFLIIKNYERNIWKIIFHRLH